MAEHYQHQKVEPELALRAGTGVVVVLPQELKLPVVVVEAVEEHKTVVGLEPVPCQQVLVGPKY
jgi:hypothetical protein